VTQAASLRNAISALLCVALLTGCATAPRHPAEQETPQPVPESGQTLGEKIVDLAMLQLGRPYQFGGNGPETFDCSGLVRFAYGAVGIETPRTTLQQYHSAAPVSFADIAPGDLLFFRIDSSKVSHVAIYSGDGRFVHAPQTGRSVETRALDEYYRSRLVSAGRFR
jgi:murein DD-endopeptidase